MMEQISKDLLHCGSPQDFSEKHDLDTTAVPDDSHA